MTDDLLDPTRDTTDTATNGSKPEYPRVGDNEDIAQRRSHQRVQALLDEVMNTRIRAANDVNNEFSPADHRKAYKSTVAELWTELRPTLASADTDTEQYYWYQIELGQFQIEPPQPLQEPAGRHEAESRPSLQPGASWATPEPFRITGFEEFNEADVVFRTRFSVRFDEDEITVPELRQRIQRADPRGRYKVWPRSGGDFEEPFRVDKMKILPKRVVDNARSALRELAEEADMGFGKPDSIDDEEDTAV
jgi:hypothetical protein